MWHVFQNQQKHQVVPFCFIIPIHPYTGRAVNHMRWVSQDELGELSGHGQESSLIYPAGNWRIFPANCEGLPNKLPSGDVKIAIEHDHL